MKKLVSKRRDINKTDRIRIDRAMYNVYLDPKDYRRKNKP